MEPSADNLLYRTALDFLSFIFFSLSLIAYGACYKHFLKVIKERSYKDTTSHTDVPTEDEHHRMLGEEYTDNDEGGEALFCAATALVLITLELIGMSHYEGTRRNLGCIFSGGNTIVTFVLKIVLLCFLVTLPLWVEGLYSVAVGSLLVVALFLFFRILEWNIRAKREQEASLDRASEEI